MRLALTLLLTLFATSAVRLRERKIKIKKKLLAVNLAREVRLVPYAKCNATRERATLCKGN